MGLFGTLIGWDQQADAWNAALANDLVENASPELRLEIANRLVIIQQQVQGSLAGSPQDTRKPEQAIENGADELRCPSL